MLKKYWKKRQEMQHTLKSKIAFKMKLYAVAFKIKSYAVALKIKLYAFAFKIK